jgi:hypothetical protein
MGWPQLTVETEVNGDLRSTNDEGVLPSLVSWDSLFHGQTEACLSVAVFISFLKQTVL